MSEQLIASKVVLPKPFTTAQLISTTATNDAAWTATSYTSGATVTHAITYDGATLPHQFRALDATVPGDVPGASAKWQDLGPANTVAMFDPLIRRTGARTWGMVSRQTSAANALVVVVAPQGMWDTVGLFGVEAQTVQVEVIDGSGTVLYNAGTLNMETRYGVDSLLEYLFNDFVLKDKALFHGLPGTPGLRLRITATLTGGTARIGGVVYGNTADIGLTPEYGATHEITPYLRPQRDDFGNYLGMVADAPRSETVNVTIYFEKTQSATVRNTINRLVNIPTVWLLHAGDDDHAEWLLPLGTYIRQGVAVPHPNMNSLALEIESAV